MTAIGQITAANASMSSEPTRTVRLREAERRKGTGGLDAIDRLECELPRPAPFAPQIGSDLLEGRLAGLERPRRADRAIGFCVNRGLLQQIKNAQKAVLHAPRFLVASGDLLRVRGSRGEGRRIGERGSAREIAVHELIEERLA